MKLELYFQMSYLELRTSDYFLRLALRQHKLLHLSSTPIFHSIQISCFRCCCSPSAPLHPTQCFSLEVEEVVECVNKANQYF